MQTFAKRSNERIKTVIIQEGIRHNFIK